MKKLKIGIMGTRGIPNQYGGFEQFAGYLSMGLREKGHEIWVYNTQDHPYQENSWNGVHIIHCKNPEKRLGAAGQFIYDRHCILDAGKRDFDVLLHLGYTSDSIWHRRWPRGMKHIINMDGLEWKRDKYNRFTRWFLRKAEKWAATRGDVLVADSTVIQEYLQQAYSRPVCYIAYAATPFTNPDPALPVDLQLQPGSYHLVISRMVPENNVEMIIRGYLRSGSGIPLVIVGDVSNRFGRNLCRKYSDQRVIFAGPVYDQSRLNNLRHHALVYFHGHSAGGTNPSLLEAMACGCTIAAHDNPFNRSVLGADAVYFNDADTAADRLKQLPDDQVLETWRQSNLGKIRTQYSISRIVHEYEEMMLNAVT